MIRPYLYILLVFFFIGRAAAAFSRWLQPSFVRQHKWSTFSTDLIEDCSDDSYILEIKDITLTPSFPVPGEDLIIEASGYLKESVEDGAEALVHVKLGVVTLIRKNFDLCKELENHDDVELKCPIGKGPVTIKQKVTLPKEIPKAHFRVAVNAYNYDDADLACLKVDVDFRKQHRGFNKYRFIGY